MKYTNLIAYTILIVVMCGCEKEEIIKEQNYVFIKEYCATVTVGGVVGISERCFVIDEVVVGFKKTDGTVTIRIAQHSPLNDGPPTSASYQEYLDVPIGYLELQNK